ncbi:MAG TPA: NUDIX domain-containing protein [Patescibacteria group bacterium]|nr:NUDIX domain-containing protein [Patescibacteria group bacterium]
MSSMINEWKAFLGEAKRTDWDSSHAVIVKEKKVLLMQRSHDDHWMPGKWGFPGGKVDKGETLEQSLKREIKEEAGLQVELEDLFYLPEISYKIKHAFFVCKKCSGSVTINANGVHEHEDHKWVTESEISSIDTVPDVIDVVKEALK